MSENELRIDDEATDGLSVAPPDPAQDADTDAARGDAGTDDDIAEDLRDDADDADARLDRGLDESMDASDPPSATQPGSGEPVPSSGYHEEAERQQDA